MAFHGRGELNGIVDGKYSLPCDELNHPIRPGIRFPDELNDLLPTGVQIESLPVQTRVHASMLGELEQESGPCECVEREVQL